MFARRPREVKEEPEPKPLPVLAVFEDLASGTVYPVQAPVAQIGRDSTNDVVLNDETVSRLHAVLGQGGFGVFTIENRSAVNGTMVNNQRVERAVLNDGDLITMGDRTLRFSRTIKMPSEERGLEHSAAVS